MDKNIKIFGYGSLLSQESLLKTVPSAKNIIPCKLVGFFRVFNAKCSRFCKINGKNVAALNIEKSEYNQYLNGICFEMNKEDFENLQKREEGYELIKVNLIDYNKNQFKAYTFRFPHFEADYSFLFNSKSQKDYFNLCYQGAKSLGEDFLEEFLETTFICEKNLKYFKKNLKLN